MSSYLKLTRFSVIFRTFQFPNFSIFDFNFHDDTHVHDSRDILEADDETKPDEQIAGAKEACSWGLLLKTAFDAAAKNPSGTVRGLVKKFCPTGPIAIFNIKGWSKRPEDSESIMIDTYSDEPGNEWSVFDGFPRHRHAYAPFSLSSSSKQHPCRLSSAMYHRANKAEYKTEAKLYRSCWLWYVLKRRSAIFY